MKSLFLIFVLFFYFVAITLGQNNAESVNSIKVVNDSVFLINDKISINTNARSISLPAIFHKINGEIEVVLCTKKGKAYESLLTTEVTPVELQTALLLLGYKSLENKVSGKNEIKNITQADSVYLYIQWTDSNKIYDKSIENFIWNMRDNALLKPVSWFFNGLLTDVGGNIIGSEGVSMIVTNYDYTSVLSINKNVIFNDNIMGVHTNASGEDFYAAKADSFLLERKIYLIIRPAQY